MDKRKYTRAIFDCEILYPTVFTDNNKKTYIESSYSLCAVDISEAGICLQSNFKIPVESFISFYLRVGDNLPFKALVKIRWNKVLEDKCIFGGEFIALSLENIYILRNYVRNQLEEA